MLRTETGKPLGGTLWKPNTPDTWNRNTYALPLIVENQENNQSLSDECSEQSLSDEHFVHKTHKGKTQLKPLGRTL